MRFSLSVEAEEDIPWWSRRGLRGLRPLAHRIQLLPQPALPEVPGGSRTQMARRARSRPVASRILPRRVHTAAEVADIAFHDNFFAELHLAKHPRSVEHKNTLCQVHTHHILHFAAGATNTSRLKQLRPIQAESDTGLPGNTE
jgi:hypothetical protein